MSKSVGNVVAPQKVIDAMGADVLRLWVAGHRLPQRDVGQRRDPQALRRRLPPHPQHRALPARQPGRLRSGRAPGGAGDMVLLDRWIVHRAHALQAQIIAAYERYDFAEIVQALGNFCGRPGRAVPGRHQGPALHDAEDSRGRRSAQTAMYHVAEAFVRWIAPILSFTADEMWAHLPGERGDNVLFETWYEGLSPLPDDARCRRRTSTRC
jgi:isoleucyl-tRNA synthetase